MKSLPPEVPHYSDQANERKRISIAWIWRGVLYYGGPECQTDWFILFPKDILVVGWDQVRKDLEFLEQETTG